MQSAYYLLACSGVVLNNEFTLNPVENSGEMKNGFCSYLLHGIIVMRAKHKEWFTFKVFTERDPQLEGEVPGGSLFLM